MAPTPSDNPITTSTEAWATLVANIAPLLVLVGEKHVKAYFKSASRPSHEALFAAGPIGLVTAVTTFIRIAGSRLLKRLIGRQFETRAELLADVTGTSDGNVIFELRGNTLEQTTEPNKQDVALFYVRSDFEGRIEDAREHSEESYKLFFKFIGSIMNTQATATCFRFETHDVEKVRRRFTGYTQKSRLTARYWMFLDPERLRGYGGDGGNDKGTEKEPIALNFCSGGFSGVSLPFTATACLDGGWKDIARYAVTAFCSLSVAGLVVANWFKQENIQSTVMISVGLVVSAIGSLVIGNAVTRMAYRHPYHMTVLHNLRAGFYSTSDKGGLALTFTPHTVIKARDNNGAPVHVNTAHTIIGLMVIGYVLLYLGLRTSEWYISLSILAVSAIASVARAVFIPDIDSLLKGNSGSSAGHAMPFHHFYSYPEDGLFLFSNDEEKGYYGKGGGRPETASTVIEEKKTYEAIFYDCDPGIPPSADPDFIASPYTAEFLHTVLTLVLYLRKHRLAPSETLNSEYFIGNPAQESVTPPVILHTDRLHPSGVLRLPLDLFVFPLQKESSKVDPMMFFRVPFNLWLWRFRQRTVDTDGVELPMAQIQTLSCVSSVDVAPGTSQEKIKWRGGSVPVTGGWKELDMIWMAAKIAMVVYRDWSRERIEWFMISRLEVGPEDPSGLLIEKDRLEAFVDNMKEEGLVKSFDIL
ncbi:hypothetical protein BJ508DRAFT_228313 [Ascobolus immersus RN42]|uniref:Uncharacterized protein n=1 Tax=Ascobolus immersus RN42 TaxID=1160509 RepID=A0A3N4HWI1_ASCIM|nr:hypothetical protein BJ508DRAFT_228313 [Ascobolus immersus RN42]